MGMGFTSEPAFSDDKQHPDPLFMEIHQEFWHEQGVGGSQSGAVSGPVPEKLEIGARSGPGLRSFQSRENGVAGREVTRRGGIRRK